MMKVCPKNKSRILKRLCSFALVILLRVSMFALPIPTHAAKSTNLPDTLTPEMAATFANHLMTYQNKQGEDSSIYFAIIETLGPDKYPVLRIIEDMYAASEESIWLFSNGKLENVYWNMDQDGSLDSGDFFISVVDGINYYGFCHYERDYEYYHRSFEIYTVESGQWKPKIQFRESRESEIDSETDELINTIETFFVTDGEKEKPISETEFDQYVNLYHVNNNSSWDERSTINDLIIALQSFEMSSKYGLEDVLPTLQEDTTYEMETLIRFLCGENFEVRFADNAELFDLAGILMMTGIIPTETDNYSYGDYFGLRTVSSDTVNQIMSRLLGRTIDFTPYQLDVLPSNFDFGNSLIKAYIVGNDFCQGYIPAGYDMWGIKMQNLYNVGNNIYLADAALTEWDDYTENYISIGKVVSLFEKVGNDYRLVKIYPIDETPTIEEVQRYIVNKNPESNFKIDYSTVSSYSDLSQYVETLKSALAATDTLNDAGNRTVTDYIDYVIQNHAPAAIYANENTVVISPETVKAAQEPAQEAKAALLDALDGLTLFRAPDLTARIDISGLDLSKPVRVRVPQDAVGAIDELDHVTMVLGDSQHMVTILADGLRQMGYLDLQLEQIAQDQYSISFFDQSDNVIEHLESNVAFTLPASSELSSVQAVCAGYSDNWGGQYDSQNKTITFQTPYTGEYTILTSTIDIPDIDYLSDEMQQAITFMVSKGYFELDSEGRFNPSVGLNRYEFTQSLIKIFFALNLDAVTSFDDVTQDNLYYPYVASGEENELLAGYDDGLFHGDNDILRVQMLAICGRTLVNKKGYSRPGDPAAYLNYVDSADIPEWSAGDLALTVREGLIESGSALRPNQPINRGEAALLLYRLFMLLYEVSPTPITVVETPPISVENEATGSISPAVIGGIVVVGIGSAGGATYFFLGKRKGISKKS